jgi:hypothetical protein
VKWGWLFQQADIAVALLRAGANPFGASRSDGTSKSSLLCPTDEPHRRDVGPVWELALKARRYETLAAVLAYYPEHGLAIAAVRGSVSVVVTLHTSHITRHTSHVTRHTPHVTRHTSHVTPSIYTSQNTPRLTPRHVLRFMRRYRTFSHLCPFPSPLEQATRWHQAAENSEFNLGGTRAEIRIFWKKHSKTAR